MNISINEYNTVINGLRQQLELQRNLTRESNQREDGAISSVNAIREENEGLKSALKTILDVNREYREDFCACLTAATGVEAETKTDHGRCVVDQIHRLIEAKNGLCADMHLVLAVAKGGKTMHEPEHECARQTLNAISRLRRKK